MVESRDIVYLLSDPVSTQVSTPTILASKSFVGKVENTKNEIQVFKHPKILLGYVSAQLVLDLGCAAPSSDRRQI